MTVVFVKAIVEVLSILALALRSSRKSNVFPTQKRVTRPTLPILMTLKNGEYSSIANLLLSTTFFSIFT
jgi:hypothetical protein